MSNKLEIGSRAPDFTALNQQGEAVHLADRIGQKIIVLYFYPKDFTVGCTMEACSFRDHYEVFTDAGADVIGVSADSPESHQAFAEKNHLPFTLLSDSDGKIAELYNIGKVLGMFPQRITFVIDQQGIIRHNFSSQINMDKHIDEALKVVQALAQAAIG